MTESILGLSELKQPDVTFLQRQAKKMMKLGDSAERAILKLARTYGLSLADCELLHLALAR